MSRDREVQMPRHWAFFANPRIYRIEEAVGHLRVDTWTTKGKPIRAGDRVAIWKGKGTDPVRGVVALAEVLTDPEPLSDSDNPFWVSAPGPNQLEDRVRLRYVRPPHLPLWVGGPADAVLRDLTVSRAQGGTVFYITPEQWHALLRAAGGWPEEAAEVAEAMEAVAERAGKRRSSQGFRSAPEVRRAVEHRAMALAVAHYRAAGWRVEDVSARESYDLHCTRPGGQELRVEVKGTTSAGAAVLLTPGEVAHARAHYPAVALFVVADISVAGEGATGPIADGGVARLLEPWRIDGEALTPVGYAYALPAGSVEDVPSRSTGHGHTPAYRGPGW